MFKVTIGNHGLHETWQSSFPKTIKCHLCGGKARHAFTVKEDFSKKTKKYVCDLYDNGGEGDFWLHDCCAVSIYFCKDCLEPSALYNQA